MCANYLFTNLHEFTHMVRNYSCLRLVDYCAWFHRCCVHHCHMCDGSLRDFTHYTKSEYSILQICTVQIHIYLCKFTICKHRRMVHMAHLGTCPGEIFMLLIFFNRFNSVTSFSNKVNKISNMTL